MRQVHLPHWSHEECLGTISKGYYHNSIIDGKEQRNNSASAAALGAGELRMPMIIFLWQLHGTDSWP